MISPFSKRYNKSIVRKYLVFDDDSVGKIIVNPVLESNMSVRVLIIATF